MNVFVNNYHRLVGTSILCGKHDKWAISVTAHGRRFPMSAEIHPDT